MNNYAKEPDDATDGILPKVYRVWTISRRLSFYQLYSWLTILRLRIKGAKVGKGLRVYGWIDIEIHPSSTVIIGDHVRINSSFALNPVGGYRRTGIWVGKNATFKIGNNAGISNSTIACMDSVIIEDGVFIGGDCKIYDTDFHPIEAEARTSHQINRIKTAAIKIGADSFVGSHSLILKGVQIGSKAVVGAGSVVTANIPDSEIWAGVPARRIGTTKNGFSKEGV